MKAYTAKDVAKCTDGKIVFGDPSSVALGASCDSRKVRENDIFFAIKGERADGHDFLPEVIEKGASIACVERPVRLDVSLEKSFNKRGFSVILVDSTIRAMAELAKDWLGNLSTNVIGITGSVGKTSTKDLMHSILSQRFSVYKNPGNLNSHIGLPLAILNMDRDYQYSILEMAMRKRGEIEELCEIAKPKIGILTDISASHIGILGSLEEIALAKAELLKSLPSDGFAMLSGDNPWVRKVAHLCQCKRFYYGFKDDSDVKAHDVAIREDGSAQFKVTFFGKTYEFSLSVPGVHQVENALAGIGVGFYLGLSPDQIQKGLSEVSLSPMRQEVLRHKGIVIINDVYNASEKSMKAALDLLFVLAKGRKIAILGDMLEMGEYGPQAHARIGAYAKEKADVLCAIGRLGMYIKDGWDQGTSSSKASSWFPDKETAERYVKSILKPGDTVLVKASRGMGFEMIVQALKEL